MFSKSEPSVNAMAAGFSAAAAATATATAFTAHAPWSVAVATVAPMVALSQAAAVARMQLAHRLAYVSGLAALVALWSLQNTAPSLSLALALQAVGALSARRQSHLARRLATLAACGLFYMGSVSLFCLAHGTPAGDLWRGGALPWALGALALVLQGLTMAAVQGNSFFQLLFANPLQAGQLARRICVATLFVAIGMSEVRFLGACLGFTDIGLAASVFGPLHALLSLAFAHRWLHWGISRAAESPHETERWYRKLVEGIPNGAALFFDNDLRIRSVGGELITRWGLTCEAMVGRPIQDFVAKTRAGDLEASCRQALAGIAGRIELQDGDALHVVDVGPLSSPDQKIDGGLAFVYDMSTRHQLEQRLRASQLDLQKAKEHAVHAMNARSDFLARMSHEIRTPLNGVVGSLELALQTDLTAEQAGYLRITHQAASGLTLLLNDILDFSKIDAGMLSLKVVAFCLDECLAPVLKPLAFKAHAKGLELIVNIAPGVPTHFEGSPERIAQVITNLINNAIKFTADGSITLRISMGGTATAKHVRFEVEDTGIGIAKANHAAVFDAFRQADASTAREYGGTGLGLAICKQLVALMRGNIHLESDLGRGTCIRFDLPLVPLAAPDRTARDEACLAGKRVLLLGSNPAQLDPLQATLRAWNMEVRQRLFPSGDLWSIAGEPGHFDVAILDVDGPLGDHQGVAETLASSYPNAKWLLLLRTNAALMLDTASIPARRLAKPALSSELLATLVSAIGPDRPTRESKLAQWPVAETALRVLVADDNAANRAVAVGILKKIGHDAVAVCNGREAVEAMERQAFDILLMDLQMPKMDGIEATRLIREREREQGAEAHLPIVALTAQDLKGEELAALQGMDGKLSKPMHHQELIAVLERVTRARHRVMTR